MGVENWEQDRPPRIKIYSKEWAGDESGVLLATLEISGDVRNEHLEWALLAEDDGPPANHVIERREWTHNWGAYSAGVDIIIEVASNPFIQGIVGGLVGRGIEEVTKKIFSRIPSDPVSEDLARHHAQVYLALSAGVTADELRLVGSGLYAKGARWVEMATADRIYRVAVAETRRGGVSVAVESWRAL